MRKKTFGAFIASLGGVLALIGIFLPWVGGSTGWDLPAGGVIALFYSFMILLGGLAVGTYGALRSMIPVGSLLVLAVGAALVKDSPTVDYGVWVYIIGAILGLIGTLAIISLKR